MRSKLIGRGQHFVAWIAVFPLLTLQYQQILRNKLLKTQKNRFAY